MCPLILANVEETSSILKNSRQQKVCSKVLQCTAMHKDFRRLRWTLNHPKMKSSKLAVLSKFKKWTQTKENLKGGVFWVTCSAICNALYEGGKLNFCPDRFFLRLPLFSVTSPKICAPPKTFFICYMTSSYHRSNLSLNGKGKC